MIAMGQYEVLKILENRNNWVLSKELLEITKMSDGGLYRILRILERSRYIVKKKAVNVIKETSRLNKSTKNAWAYKIR